MKVELTKIRTTNKKPWHIDVEFSDHKSCQHCLQYLHEHFPGWIYSNRPMSEKPLSKPVVTQLSEIHICATWPIRINPSSDRFLRQWPGSPLVQVVACPLYRLKQNEHLFIVSGISQTNCSEIWMQNPAFNDMCFESVCKWRLFSIVLYWIDLKHHR